MEKIVLTAAVVASVIIAINPMQFAINPLQIV